MKRLIALLLTVVMVFALCACGGGGVGAVDEKEQSAEVAEETAQEEIIEETPEPDSDNTVVYAIGEAFGTDCVECVIDEVSWITLEDMMTNPATHDVEVFGRVIQRLDMDSLYPDYKFIGITGLTATSDYPNICILYSLKNVGKVTITPNTENGYNPYGSVSVVYDDGYIFEHVYDNGFDHEHYEGLSSVLEVLGDPVKEGRLITVKEVVYENEDIPLMIKVTLPNSAGETEEFYVTVR